MTKRNQNYTDKLHDSIDRLEKIRDQDAGDNDVFTCTIDAMIEKLFRKTQDEWKKRKSKPKKRSGTRVPEIITQKGTDDTV
jgi:hypothetical protein